MGPLEATAVLEAHCEAESGLLLYYLECRLYLLDSKNHKHWNDRRGSITPDF